MNTILIEHYKYLISRSIENSATPDHLKVCLDFLQLFKERFKPFLHYDDFNKHYMELMEAFEARSKAIKYQTDEVQP
jgi:hypothetical protein